MKYEIQRTSQFKKDYKTAVKRGFKISLLKEVVLLLADGQAAARKEQGSRINGRLERLS